MSDTFTSAVINVYNGTGSVFTTDLSTYGKNTVTFGNSPANDIFINSPAVSEHHGYFQFTNLGWVIFDNHSKNGISVNGAKRKDVKLSDGMEIRIADESNKSIPAATMFVDIKSNEPYASVSVHTDNVTDTLPQPKKKSKAPLIIVIVLLVLFVGGGAIALVLGLLGVGVYNYVKPNEQSSVQTDDTIVQQYDDYTDDAGSIDFTENGENSDTSVPVELPEKVPASSGCAQYILAKCDGTNATLTLYEKEDGVWVERLTANGRVGKNGITYSKREGDGCTPAGEFDLTFCCGLSDPGTDMDFQRIDSNSVWVDDVNSRYYNTLQNADSYSKDWDSAEPMYSSYFKDNRHNYCINIAANGDGMSSQDAIPGCGSVITLCGKNDTLTETHGCMDISGSDMLDFLSYLDSGKSPVIIIY